MLKAAAYARYIRARPEFENVRTRHRSPETNGVIERWYVSINHEHLYLHGPRGRPSAARLAVQESEGIVIGAR